MRASLRIIAAIAAKDIVDAIKNKTTLSIMLGVGLLMLSGLALPMLLGLQDLPTAIVYDPGKSTLVKALTTRSEFRLRLVDSQEDMQELLCSSPKAALGLVIPPEFRQAASSGSAVDIEGYFAHWAGQDKIAELVALFEDELGKASWQTIRIDTQGHVVYPAADSVGQSLMISITLTTVILVIGLALVPHLLVEEKETHTFEALMVSPARFSQVVAGKAIAGMFYCLCAAVVGLGFNAKFFVHWELAILAAVLGAAFAVAAGLLMGALFDNPMTINLWMGVLIIALLVPTLLERISSSKIPQLVRTIVPYMPSVAMNKLLAFSMAGDIRSAPVGLNAAILAVATLAVYGLVVWRVRQMDR